MPSVSLHIAERVAQLRLEWPRESPALEPELAEDLLAACERIEAADDVTVVLLLAEGPAFAAEWSPRFFAENDSHLDSVPSQVCDRLAGLAAPVVCAVSGRATGAGLELALASDIRIAGEGASFAVPDVVRGLLPAAGATQRLPRLIGRAWAAWTLLTGEEMSASDALRLGLVTAVYADDAVDRQAQALAHRLAQGAPLALRYAKEALRNGLEMPLEQALRHELDLAVILQTTRDRAEGVRAFLEKRPPEFQGE